MPSYGAPGKGRVAANTARTAARPGTSLPTRTIRYGLHVLAVIVVGCLVAVTASAVHDSGFGKRGQSGGRQWREPPGLLSRRHVERGLDRRHHNLQRRFAAHARRRSHAAPEHFAVRAHARGLGLPRPDAPGGEFNPGRHP